MKIGGQKKESFFSKETQYFEYDIVRIFYICRTSMPIEVMW